MGIFRAAQTFAIVASSVILVAAQSHPAASVDDLQHYEFSQLTLLGTFKQGKDVLACFQLPDHSLRSARLRDYVGPDHAIISLLSPGYVEISQPIAVNQGEFGLGKFRWPIKSGAKAISKCPSE